ncbi:MAG: peptidylprolyl isomerase [Thermodesulfobacteriota bacterium]
MSPAKIGDTVMIHYTGTLEDGTVFDSSEGRVPLQFTLGEGMVIPGFETAVTGMSPTETKTEKIPAAEAYGPYVEDLVVVVGKEHLPDDLKPEVGRQLELHQEEGKTTVVTITEVNETNVTLDANHPLAGKDLTFRIELVEIA